MAKFATLFSSSSGNCAYIQQDDRLLLIDCGKNCKAILNGLHSHGLSMSMVQGILLTHEHSDHISALKVLLKHYPVPVYGAQASLLHLSRAELTPPYAELVHVSPEQPFSVGDFHVQAFKTEHDSLAAHGYKITLTNGKTLAYATDTGAMTQEIFDHLKGCNVVALESNYDKYMLENGRYPAYLKRRIAGKKGHLCNDDSAQTVLKLAAEGTEQFVLCHLSKENNDPGRVNTGLVTAFAQQKITFGNGGYRIAPKDAPCTPVDF